MNTCRSNSIKILLRIMAVIFFVIALIMMGLCIFIIIPGSHFCTLSPWSLMFLSLFALPALFFIFTAYQLAFKLSAGAIKNMNLALSLIFFICAYSLLEKIMRVYLNVPLLAHPAVSGGLSLCSALILSAYFRDIVSGFLIKRTFPGTNAAYREKDKNKSRIRWD